MFKYTLGSFTGCIWLDTKRLRSLAGDPSTTTFEKKSVRGRINFGVQPVAPEKESIVKTSIEGGGLQMSN
jgi:hypothetical protein